MTLADRIYLILADNTEYYEPLVKLTGEFAGLDLSGKPAKPVNSEPKEYFVSSGAAVPPAYQSKNTETVRFWA